MHLWAFLHTVPIDTVVDILKREPTNDRPRTDEEQKTRMEMLIGVIQEAKAFDKLEAAGIDINKPPFNVAFDLKYSVGWWRDEVATWAACQKYFGEAQQIEAYDLLIERLGDMVDAGEKLPERLVDPAAALLERPSCTL
jgi:hypothetical protein